MGSTKTVTNEVIQRGMEAGVGVARLEVGVAWLLSHRVGVHACDTCPLLEGAHPPKGRSHMTHMINTWKSLL